MLSDDDCRAIREAIGQPAMSFDRVRAMVRAINAMPDGPVWVVPREASGRMVRIGDEAMDRDDSYEHEARSAYRDMTKAGAAEVGEG